MKSALEIGAEVTEHWYTLVPSQNFSSKDFYDLIEAGIKAQKVPALATSRIDLAEGGVLSDKREYLRMKRERLTFDVCAAPVGVNYFFSYRFYDEPVVVSPWEIVAIIVVFTLTLDLSMRYIGPFLGPFLLVALCALLVWLMRNAVGQGLRDVDAALVKLPAVGPIYEKYFRKDTYYRQDLRIAYCSIVGSLVKQEVERATGAKGVKLLREFTYSPLMKDLYRAKETSPQAVAEPEPVAS